MHAETIQAIMHDPGDSVAVVVAEGVEPEQELRTWIMEGNRRGAIVARQAIPVGHKIAMKDIPEGTEVVKYGATIGLASADIRIGDHVHIHNIRSRHW